MSNHFAEALKALKFNEGVTNKRHKVAIHTLRHTFASWLAQMGTPLYTVSKLMGHSSIKMTERYAHLARIPKRRRLWIWRVFSGLLTLPNNGLDNEGKQNEAQDDDLKFVTSDKAIRRDTSIL